MSTQFNSNMAAGAGSRKWLSVSAVFLLALLIPLQAVADDGALYRSLLLPGSGQAHKGHYKKAAIFAGVTVLSAAGVFMSQIQYNQAADRYYIQSRNYRSYQDLINAGQIVSIEEMNATYREMESAWNDADTRIKWRNGFLVVLVGTYVVNVVDVLMTKPHKVDPEQMEESRYSIEADGQQVRFAAKFRF